MPFEIQDLDDRRDPHRAPDSRRDIEEPEDQPRVAVAVRDVTLREEPDSAATEVARVDRGTQLYVMKLEGDWVLVVHQGRGGLEVGWARSREVAIR
jgi:hypothetical protein